MTLPTPDYAAAIARPTAPGWQALRRGALLLDRSIGRCCEAIGAALVLAEVVILFAGYYPDMKKTAGDKAWALLEKYVGPLTA